MVFTETMEWHQNMQSVIELYIALHVDPKK